MNRINKEYLKKRKAYVSVQKARYGETSIRRGLCALQGLCESDLDACSGDEFSYSSIDTPHSPGFCNLEGIDIASHPLEKIIGEFPCMFPDGNFVIGFFLVDIRYDAYKSLSVSVCKGIPARLAGGTTVYDFQKAEGRYILRKAVDELMF